MDIFINNQKIDYAPVDSISWSEILENLLKNYIGKDHGVVKLVIDGQENQGFVNSGVNVINEGTKVVEIYTKNAADIVANAIIKAQGILVDLKDSVNSVAELYREGNIKEASESWKNIQQAMLSFVVFLHTISNGFKIDFSNIQYSEDTVVSEKVSALTDTLNDIVKAQEKGDFVELADFLEYQLNEDFDSWQTILQIISREINSTAVIN